MFDIVDPYGRYYGLPFRSRYRILDIILLELVSSFLLGYFFIAGRLCINDVAQQCHITTLCLRPLSFFESIIILFLILDYFSCPRWSSSFEVDLPFSLYSSESLSFSMVSLTWEASGSSLNYCYSLFGTIYNSSSFSWLETFHNFQNILIVTNICHISMWLFYPMLHSSISCIHTITSRSIIP